MSREVNKYGLPRYIEAHKRRIIRQECGFGCVICGCLIYQYEHFDPDFAEAIEHDPKKIALLCGGCHDKVSRGFWSKEKVSEGRRNPVCKKMGHSHEEFDIGANPIPISLGGALFVNPRAVLSIMGEELFSVERPEEPGAPFRISGRFYNSAGELMFRIVENEWQGRIENWDIEIAGKTITIRRDHREIALKMTVVPRQDLRIDPLDMSYQGVRVFANQDGICFGEPKGIGYGYRGMILNAESCLQVIDRSSPMTARAALSMMDPGPGSKLDDIVVLNAGGPAHAFRGVPAYTIEFGSLRLNIGAGASLNTGAPFEHHFR